MYARELSAFFVAAFSTSATGILIKARVAEETLLSVAASFNRKRPAMILVVDH